MSLPNTESLTAGFPLVIPTGSQQPAARLVLRNDRGQAVQQWLIKQNKCTLGSASGCSLKCELQGIAPYHALLVIGSRQIFIRALAPKLTRNGRPFNEILLTEEESHFEIAGHRFELSRSSSALGSATKNDKSKNERLKFTLARPFELSQRRAPATTIVSAPSSPTESMHSSPANMDGKWVAKLIRSAVEPLESQLQNLIEPLAELTAESRKFRRLQDKWLRDKQVPAEPPVAVVPNTPIVDPKITRQVEDLVLKHSSSMEMLTERISDVNQQLSAIERIIAEERAENLTTPVLTEDPRLAQHSLAVEQLQAGMGIVSETLDRLQSQQSQEDGVDQQWRTGIHEKLLGLSEVVASLTTTVAEVHRNVLGQQEQLRLVSQVDQDAPWKANIQDQLADLSVAMQQLSGTLTDVRQEVVRQQERPLPKDTSAMDQQWKSQIQDHLSNLSQVFDTLTGTVAEVQQNTLQQLDLQRSAETQHARDPWRATVEGQFASLTQVIAGLSSNLNDIQLKTLGEIEQQTNLLQELQDSPWQSTIEHKIQELSQVVEGLAASVNAVQVAVSEEKPEPQAVPDSEAMSQWKLEVRQQLSALTEIVTGLATTVNEVHQIAISESTDQVEYTQTCHLPRTADTWTASEQPASEQRLQAVQVAPPVELEPIVDEVPFTQDSPHDEFSNWNLQPDIQDQLQDQDQDLEQYQAQDLEQYQVQDLLQDQDQDQYQDELQDRAVVNVFDSWGQPDALPVPENPMAWPTSSASDDAQEQHNADPAWDSVAERLSLPLQAEESEDEEPLVVSPNLSADLDSTQPEDEFVYGGDLFASDASDFSQAILTDSDSGRERSQAYPRLPEVDTVSNESAQEDLLVGFQSEEPADILSVAVNSELPVVDAEEATLPSWWRDEDDDPLTNSNAVLADAHDAPRAEERDYDHQFASQDRDSFRDKESEEFYGLAQLDPQELPLIPAIGESPLVSLPASSSSLTPDNDRELHEDLGDGLFGMGVEAAPAAADVLQPAHLPMEDFPGLEVEPPIAPAISESHAKATGSDMAREKVSDEDDSVEDYMRKLLARMRGVPEEEVELPTAAVAPSKAVVPAPTPENLTTATVGPRTEARHQRTTAYAANTELDSLDVTEPFDPEKYMPRALAPERTGSMAAMRELANSSARTAIHKSTRKRHVSSIVLKLVISVVGLVVGGILLAINGLNLNIGLVATVASFLVAAIWGFDSLTSIRPMLQSGLVLRPDIRPANMAKAKPDADDSSLT